MNTSILKIKKDEVKINHAKSFIVGQQKIAVCNINGQIYAVEDICSHDDGELVSSECELVESCQIECPRHGARFDVRTGAATKMPAVVGIKTFNVKTVVEGFEVEIED